MRFLTFVFSLFLTVFLTVFLLACTEKTSLEKPTVEKPISSQRGEMEALFQTELDALYTANPNAVGILVHIQAPDLQISWSGAAGYADKEQSKKLEANQPVLLASNTKTYVAAAILRLFEDGYFKLDDPVRAFLSPQTQALLTSGGYNVDTITIRHLLTHTSGIADYNAVEGLFDFLRDNPKHIWTREEQITRAMTLGQTRGKTLAEPLGQAGDVFNYADTNYLLLGEIIEQVTGHTFYKGVRQLIDYKKQGMHDTWWIELETKPTKTKAFAHQYATELGLQSANMHPSFDLFGGGGIASTVRDLGVFTQNLFTGKVYNKPSTLDIMLIPAAPKTPMQGEYMSGLSSIDVASIDVTSIDVASNDVGSIRGIGHGGFWGSAANYFPELNASIAVIVLERDQRALRGNVNQVMVSILQRPTPHGDE